MIKRSTPKTHSHWFEEDEDDYWYDELDLRFIIPGLMLMLFCPILAILTSVNWVRISLLIGFFSSFIIVTKRKRKPSTLDSTSNQPPDEPK
ncbi:MAG TPA: hypothetical protein PKA82_17520 [Pyrinomonadaceae bacterium]|nr:hypothetical protein [Pyrinomonadaceae bacterium]